MRNVDDPKDWLNNPLSSDPKDHPRHVELDMVLRGRKRWSWLRQYFLTFAGGIGAAYALFELFKKIWEQLG